MRETKSKFIKVKCQKCKNEQNIFPVGSALNDKLHKDGNGSSKSMNVRHPSICYFFFNAFQISSLVMPASLKMLAVVPFGKSLEWRGTTTLLFVK